MPEEVLMGAATGQVHADTARVADDNGPARKAAGQGRLQGDPCVVNHWKRRSTAPVQCYSSTETFQNSRCAPATEPV